MSVTVRQILGLLQAAAPQELALSWDNVGLLVDAGKPVDGVLTALDITPAVVREAVENDCQLIVSHHPVIFQPIKSLAADDVPALLMKNGISAICMHTNLDAAEGGVNDCLARKLGLQDAEPFNEEKIGRIGTISCEKPLEEFLQDVVKLLGCRGLRYHSGERPVRRVAVGGGACGEYIQRVIDLGCDTFVTSDLGYHDFLDTQGLNLIDAGHFPTENVVCEELVRRLSEAFPTIQITKSAVHHDAVQFYMS